MQKYRAWDHADEEMVNDVFFDWQDCGYESLNECLADERWSFMQSTSLKDKNGVEIFEGDLLKNKDIPDTILICEKSDLQASFRARSTNGMISLIFWYEESEDWTVIGNIYEHPHLLEVPHEP